MSPAHMALWLRADSSSSSSSFSSSWDKCMSKTYCKWPVIVAIIICAVIVICIVGCVINCLCCGYQCCKCCCGCCCPSGRRKSKKPKYYDETPLNQPPPPPPEPIYQPSPAPPVYRGAVRTATFDSPKTTTANDDELPAMPTWASAVDKRIEDESHHDEVEMEPLGPDRKQGAGTPMHPGAAYSDYPPTRTPSAPGYRGFNPTDPYARRSPGPAAALAVAQDPYRRSPVSNTSPIGAGPIDPYGRRSPGPAAAYGVANDPYTRRSPVPSGPAATYAAAQDPYGRRSPGIGVAVGAPAAYDQPYDHQPYDHQPYDHQQPYTDYAHGADNQLHTVGSPTPIAAYNPHNNYNPAPMAFSPDSAHAAPAAGFQRQPSFGSTQYPPTYTSQAASPPPPFQSHANSEFEYTMEPTRERPPTLLQSGRKPAPNTFRDV
ncbi:hypothetical protein N7462_011637 [Penicillium macrosclerotiorum]|uniref:uncharacterized protein n=1 Tax=Penicillium macrosclerotiorum TaxID=303699 RepID=UPI002547D139|nr:uncharacterized protein N7462_011637 [Penicillium macrosclerotiorum]KAJ5662711.1 hypothetical protein N7462_011637 [Penicillium macrosclerotiorum]